MKWLLFVLLVSGCASMPHNCEKVARSLLFERDGKFRVITDSTLWKCTASVTRERVTE